MILNVFHLSPTDSQKQRGDTLIEVTIALAILSMVLVGAFETANRAFQVGQASKERSIVADAAQQQLEALESFRDSHTWAQFINGDAAGNYGGIHSRFNINPCNSGEATSHCFHMIEKVVNGVNQWVPVKGSAHVNLPTNYVSIETFPTDISDNPAPSSYEFIVYYGVIGVAGTPKNYGQIPLTLVDLDALR